MLFRSAGGRGNPVLRGVEVKPNDDGLYEVPGPDAEVLLSLGYEPADAPAKRSAPKASRQEV